ncbi:hypothetical protein [Myceligenerans salitolerans]|uniref:Uncharacterized protein n=1 Tax=Myceligenerans salitolerans TaxID=1230528 RepID=A0ABS3ICI7_9MICO|nr:hypothetical protein [Myceligenerans salitolerans]MBO0610713.1 hypothetical protein [Myceligenerans salitolerans]
MIETTKAIADAIASHTEALFGKKWTEILSWTVYGAAAVWLYWHLLSADGDGTIRMDQVERRPLDGVSSLLAELDAAPPAWLYEAITWSTSPDRSALVAILAILCAAAAITSARSPNPGWAILTVLRGLAAVQGGGMHALWITAAAIAAPVAVSILLGLLQGCRKVKDKTHTPLYTTQQLLNVFVPFGLVLAAPIVALFHLVKCFSMPRREDAGALELSSVSLRALRDSGDAEDRRTAHHALVIAGALLAMPDERDDHARSLSWIMTGPTGARIPDQSATDAALRQVARQYETHHDPNVAEQTSRSRQGALYCGTTWRHTSRPNPKPTTRAPSPTTDHVRPPVRPVPQPT